MGHWLAGLLVAGALLLIAAGLPKLRDPDPLVRALRSARLPGSRGLVRGLAALEVATGGWVLARPARPSALAAALLYAVFTAFVLLARRRGGVLSSCGCFATPDTPASAGHAVLTAAAALVALGAALDPAGLAWAGRDLGEVLLLLGSAGLVGLLAWQVLAVLPTVASAALREHRA